MDYITVQRLSSHVEGKYQKYSRIGPLASVPLGEEPTTKNVKEACKHYFDVEDGMCCDILAGERGPSWMETSQITSFKAIHVRFIEAIEMESQLYDGKPEPNTRQRCRSQGTPEKRAPEKRAPSMSSKVAASVPLSAMLKLGKFIQPTA